MCEEKKSTPVPLVLFNKWRWRFFILLVFLFIAYCIRLYQVEATRELAQDGIMSVIMDEVPEIRDRQVEYHAGGLTCNYFFNLTHCIGISFGSRVEEIPNVRSRIQYVLVNFCSIVKKRYPRQAYDVYTAPYDANIFQVSIANAYFGFYQCETENSHPLGKVTVFSVPAEEIYDAYGEQFSTLATKR